MQLEFVRYEKRGRIAWVTIDRPEVMNALHPPANEELSRVWDDFAALLEAWPADVPCALVVRRDSTAAVSAACAVVDPVGDIAPYLRVADNTGMRINFVIDTHIHADHRSAGRREFFDIMPVMSHLQGRRQTTFNRHGVSPHHKDWHIRPPRWMWAQN